MRGPKEGALRLISYKCRKQESLVSQLDVVLDVDVTIMTHTIFNLLGSGLVLITTTSPLNLYRTHFYTSDPVRVDEGPLNLSIHQNWLSEMQQTHDIAEFQH